MPFGGVGGTKMAAQDKSCLYVRKGTDLFTKLFGYVVGTEMAAQDKS